MVKMKKCFGRICLAAIIIAFATPLVSTGSEEGHDWYCSDKETHTKYESHLKKHIDHSAEAITEKLAVIFCNKGGLHWSLKP